VTAVKLAIFDEKVLLTVERLWNLIQETPPRKETLCLQSRKDNIFSFTQNNTIQTVIRCIQAIIANTKRRYHKTGAFGLIAVREAFQITIELANGHRCALNSDVSRCGTQRKWNDWK
jgi:hypothetical protein